MIDSLGYPWSSLVEGGEGLYLPNCQTNLVIALYALSLLFCKFINTTANHLGRYDPSSPVDHCIKTATLIVSKHNSQSIPKKQFFQSTFSPQFFCQNLKIKFGLQKLVQFLKNPFCGPIFLQA